MSRRLAVYRALLWLFLVAVHLCRPIAIAASEPGWFCENADCDCYKDSPSNPDRHVCMCCGAPLLPRRTAPEVSPRPIRPGMVLAGVVEAAEGRGCQRQGLRFFLIVGEGDPEGAGLRAEMEYDGGGYERCPVPVREPVRLTWRSGLWTLSSPDRYASQAAFVASEATLRWTARPQVSTWRHAGWFGEMTATGKTDWVSLLHEKASVVLLPGISRGRFNGPFRGKKDRISWASPEVSGHMSLSDKPIPEQLELPSAQARRIHELMRPGQMFGGAAGGEFGLRVIGCNDSLFFGESRSGSRERIFVAGHREGMPLIMQFFAVNGPHTELKESFVFFRLVDNCLTGFRLNADAVRRGVPYRWGEVAVLVLDGVVGTEGEYRDSFDWNPGGIAVWTGPERATPWPELLWPEGRTLGAR